MKYYIKKRNCSITTAALGASKISSNFGKSFDGWWWGVWQEERLVDFGAGYQRKEKCFRHQRDAIKRAISGQLKTVVCSHPSVISLREWKEDLRAELDFQNQQKKDQLEKWHKSTAPSAEKS